MNAPPGPPDDWTTLEVLTCLACDQESGRVQSLAHYLGLFPGHEELVAREFLTFQQAGAGVPPESPHAAAISSGVSSSAGADEVLEIGPYRIRSELGRGGQGVVYLATDTRSDRPVALKLLAGRAGRHDSPARFLREAELTGKLDHPGICEIYECGQAGDVWYIAMRYVPGKSLARLLDEADGAPLEIDRALRLIAEAARALDVAHRGGIVHRDIKPANIMIDEGDHPVLLDFGLARDLESQAALLTRTGDVFGTPAYMSPEQLDRSTTAIGPASDIWSLAVVLYECVSGHRPFDATLQEGIFDAIRHQEPTNPLRFNPRLPRALATLLQVALDKNPRRRYASAARLAQDLERVRSNSRIQARPPSMPVRLGRAARRSPGVATGTIALFLFLIIALIQTNAQREAESGLRRTADRRADELRRLTRHILIDFHGAVRDMPGTTIASKEMVARALEFLELLGPGEDGEIAPEIRRDLALAHLEIGDVLGNHWYANLGQPAQADRHYQRALQLALAFPAGEATDLLARCHLRVGSNQELTDRVHVAVASFERGIEVLTAASVADTAASVADPAASVAEPAVSAAEPAASVAEPEERVLLRAELQLARARCIARATGSGDRTTEALRELDALADRLDRPAASPAVRICLAATLLVAARLHDRTVDGEAAEQSATRARAILAGLPLVDQARLRVRLLLAECYTLLARAAHDRARFADSQSLLQQAVHTLRILVELDPANELARRKLIAAQRELGQGYAAVDDFTPAKTELNAALALLSDSEARFGQHWATTERALCFEELGNIHYELRESAPSMELFRAAREIWVESYAADRSDARRRERVARAELRLGRALRQAGENAEARTALVAAREHLTALRAGDRHNLSYTRQLQNIGQLLAELSFQAGDYEAAAARFDEAIALRVAAEGDADDVEAIRSLAILRQGLANSIYQCRRFSAAQAAMAESLALFRRNAARAPNDHLTQRQLALALLDTARIERRVSNAGKALVPMAEASRLVEQITLGPDVTPKAMLTGVYVHAFAAYLHLETGDSRAARAACDAAQALRSRAPELRVPSVYERMLEGVRQQLGSTEK